MLSIWKLQEKLTLVGYPSPLTSDAFFQPNFDKIVEILLYFRFCLSESTEKTFEHLKNKPSMELEEDRARFMKEMVTFFLKNGNLRLNPKKLYQSDVQAVPELLKIADLIYKARRTVDHPETISQSDVDTMGILNHTKQCKELAQQIQQQLAESFKKLNQESGFMNERQETLARQVQLDEIKQSVHDQLSSMAIQVDATTSTIQRLQSDKQTLIQKIAKRKQELERVQQRLKSLQSVRPPYMDEYDKLELVVEQLYNVFTERFRHLSYLEHQLHLVHEEEKNRDQWVDHSLKKLQSHLQNEEYLLLKGNQQTQHDDDEDEEYEDNSNTGEEDDEQSSDLASLNERLMEYRNTKQLRPETNKPVTFARHHQEIHDSESMGDDFNDERSDGEHESDIYIRQENTDEEDQSDDDDF